MVKKNLQKMKGCGGISTLLKGQTGECEYCGSTIQGKSLPYITHFKQVNNTVREVVRWHSLTFYLKEKSWLKGVFSFPLTMIL